MSYGYTTSHNDPQINAIPAFHTEELAESGSTLIEFENVTKQITIQAQIQVMISINATSGAHPETFFLSPTNPDSGAACPVLTFDAQCNSIRITNVSGSATNFISVLAVLSRIPSVEFPDITAANGFERVR